MNFAQVLVQNKVNLALPSLPDVVKQTGVTTRKRSPDILMVVTLTSPDDRYNQLYLSNYMAIHVKDELARIDGVGDVIAFGAKDYSMRIWVDPERLAGMNLNASRRGQCRPQPELASRHRPNRPAAGRPGPAMADHARHAGPARRSGAVRRNRHQADGRRTDVRIKDIGHVELRRATSTSPTR